MSKQFIPKKDRVLIKPLDSGEQMYGSIVIPDMGKEKPELGEVIAVGPGAYEFGTFVETEAEVGQIVYVPKIGTLRIDIDGDEYYITKDKEILGELIEDNDE